MSHINLDLQASHKMLMLLDEANASLRQWIRRPARRDLLYQGAAAR